MTVRWWSPRAVHPGAWWLWACCLGAAVTQTTNPVLLVLAGVAVGLVVLARRPDAPWARTLRLYLFLATFIITVRVLLFVLIGAKVGNTVLVRLPTVDLPSWAAGIQLLGPIPLEGLLAALFEGLRLATMLLCFAAANTLANPRQLLRSLPSALRDVGTAVVVALSVVPQLTESVGRVGRARELRGERVTGLRGLRHVALPVLQDTLDRSLALAASMDARGYGNQQAVPARERRLVAALSLGGLFAVCVGLYGLLDEGSTPAWVGLPMVVAGVLLGGGGLALAGRRVPRSTYRPAAWRGPENLVAACGILALVGVLVALRLDPAAASMPLEPIGIPRVPTLAVLGLLLAAVPAFATPTLPPAIVRGRRAEAAA